MDALDKQKTIKSAIEFSGKGLHTGKNVRMKIKPAPENSGINFIRVDIPGTPVISANIANFSMESGITRCTCLSQKDAVIHTVEHLLSVLCGLGISNLDIEIDSDELPGLDGSGKEFLEKIKQCGIVEQDQPQEVFFIKEPIGVSNNESSIYIVPSEKFKISYTLDYNHSYLNSQFLSLEITQDIFEKKLASCRTFCLEEEANELRERGLGKGANYQNTLVISEKGVKENALRFPDEFARHKILDFIGDLYLLGMPIKGHVFAVKSGHALNLKLLQEIVKQKQKYDKKGTVSEYDFEGKKEIDIKGIMSVLPHRYPFLLVDRVIEIEKGKRAVGIKNVTINDGFFQGHFPNRPVMPGVLMVEAMAQTSGVLFLSDLEHRGKLAFFMAIDKVKFRKIVVPGDQLIMEIEVLKSKSRVAQVRGVSKVNDEIVVEADMTFTFADTTFLS